LSHEQDPFNVDINFEKEQPMTQVAVIDLGPNNIGTFGPAPGTPEIECIKKAETSCDEKYNRPATNRYICVDGRLTVQETAVLEAGDSPEKADPQIAGGIAVSETAASYMDTVSTHAKQSLVVAGKTRSAVEDGIKVTVHGDQKKGKAGCKALADIRTSLHFNAENADIVAPKAWAVSQALGLDQWINEDDITSSVLDGKRAADNDELWDVTPEEASDIMVANGAEYLVCVGDHQEESLRIDITEGAFSKVDHARDNSTPDHQAQAFSASMGKYKKDRFARTLKHGGTERDAALEVMRVILFNADMSKILINENTKVGLVLPTQN
jgi:hypothetical protein